MKYSEFTNNLWNHIYEDPDPKYYIIKKGDEVKKKNNQYCIELNINNKLISFKLNISQENWSYTFTNNQNEISVCGLNGIIGNHYTLGSEEKNGKEFFNFHFTSYEKKTENVYIKNQRQKCYFTLDNINFSDFEKSTCVEFFASKTKNIKMTG